ncbi:MAG: xanthine dehydrogenase family protein molybdopterin-binding subunit, partial [Actinomycetota bacterium]
MLRREDAPILRGAARYIDDLTLPGMLHMVVVRSSFAHANLGAIDASDALATPGVVAVLTAEDLAGRAGPMPIAPAEDADVAAAPIPLLASGRVRFAGEPVAAVMAETRAIAEDAAELLAVGYDPLPVVADPVSALADGAIALHDVAADNVLVRWRRTFGDVEGALATAAHVILGRFHIPRIAAAPIEPRGALAAHDAGSDLLTM